MSRVELKLNLPVEGKVLLHCCCAPCSSAILECMKDNALDVTVFFSNSNIFPVEEYEIRKRELIRYCESLGVEYAEDDYDHKDWLEKVGRGRESCPERGARCLECFRYRLKRAAEFGEKQGCKLLTTTLASSRWKNIEQINEAGREAVEGKEILWWDMNWRKGGLQPRRCELIKELGFYNQTFCGCEFSQNNR
ncbi:MAG: epoxyqueuosine reductase QueH [Candidatus Cryptobacteroides sp.]